MNQRRVWVATVAAIILVIAVWLFVNWRMRPPPPPPLPASEASKP